MSHVAEKLRGFFADHGEKLRFLAVGVLNTAVSYGLFWAAIRLFATPLELATGADPKTIAIGVQWAVWVVAVVWSTVTMKYLVFRSKGPLAGEVFRAYFVYLPAQGLSSLILYSAMRFLGASALVGQLFAVFVTTILSYLGHKHFTFRTRTGTPSRADGSAKAAGFIHPVSPCAGPLRSGVVEPRSPLSDVEPHLLHGPP